MQTMSTKNDILAELFDVVRDRCTCPTTSSYVSQLVADGLARINAKITEEARELADASLSGIRRDIVHEAADLWFHCIVLLGRHDIHPDEVFDELRRRRGVSGLAEKDSRKQHGTRS